MTTYKNNILESHSEVKIGGGSPIYKLSNILKIFFLNVKLEISESEKLY